MSDNCPRNDLDAAPIVPCLDVTQLETIVATNDQVIPALGEDQVIRVPPQ